MFELRACLQDAVYARVLCVCSRNPMHGYVLCVFAHFCVCYGKNGLWLQSLHMLQNQNWTLRALHLRKTETSMHC